MEGFTEILVDEGVSAPRDTPASTSRESDQELSTTMVSAKHSVCSHFPKDRNCEVCKRTKNTRVPCRKRTCNPALEAENVGDLITADHKVLSEECESRNNHRCRSGGTIFGFPMVAIVSV